MRCPYCGGLNPDQLNYCINCGRDLTRQPPAQQPGSGGQRTGNTPSLIQQPVYPPPPPVQRPLQPPPMAPANQRPAHSTGRTGTTMPPSNPQPYRPAQPQQQPPAPANATAVRRQKKASTPEAPIEPKPAVPDAPAPFPPRSITHLKQLEQGALDYTFTSEEKGYGKKRIIHISYRHCAPWQQVATLFHALNAYDAEKFDTVVIQGIQNEQNDLYSFNNGQLTFDRNVHLGSQILKRYVFETENGLVIDALRIILTE
ncbi:hypothetical protein [Tengunoibacter tsumagoiensis]|uniref:Zinc-ribbon domain-containing protein n=1 Tax=Tengunoibacter tsumagoiensis TaxID=2014871 RepID=A0A401ZTF8_9CHLR|nr:hypothetical protein [Tengunoibacter tsumagoiensis]GCE10151.1 hypothetical protein KTT_00100 [Tengunoibacter tsumagoiensis]